MPHVPAAALVALVGLHQCTCILIQALSCPRCPLRALVVHFVVASSISKVLKCSNHSFIKFRSCVFYRCRSQYTSANSNVHGNTSTPAARRRMCFSHHGVVPLYSVTLQQDFCEYQHTTLSHPAAKTAAPAWVTSRSHIIKVIVTLQ